MTKTETTRIDEMVESWEKTGRAFSHIDNKDGEFFTRIGVNFQGEYPLPSRVGYTSQTGTDLIYYDTKIFRSDRDAIREIRQDSMAADSRAAVGAVNQIMSYFKA